MRFLQTATEYKPKSYVSSCKENNKVSSFHAMEYTWRNQDKKLSIYYTKLLYIATHASVVLNVVL